MMYHSVDTFVVEPYTVTPLPRHKIKMAAKHKTNNISATKRISKNERKVTFIDL